MKKSILLFGWMLALVSTFTFVSCDDDDDDDDDVTVTNNIVEELADNPNYSSLVAAVEAAGLTSILSGDGPFTVFAPNNAAFDAFLSTNGFNNLDEVPVDLLTDVLTNHVLAADLPSTDLQTAYYSTLSATDFGQDIVTTLYVDTDGGVVLNGESNVINADIEASNGTIHGLDAVINLPTVVTFAASNDVFSSLVAALTDPRHTTDFLGLLTDPAGTYTVFAPTNDAFQALLDSNNDWNTIGDIPIDVLDTVLKYHVVSGSNVRSENLSDGLEVTPLAGGTFTVNIDGTNVTIDAAGSNANVILADVQGINGVVHAIDAVLIPSL